LNSLGPSAFRGCRVSKRSHLGGTLFAKPRDMISLIEFSVLFKYLPQFVGLLESDLIERVVT